MMRKIVQNIHNKHASPHNRRMAINDVLQRCSPTHLLSPKEQAHAMGKKRVVIAGKGLVGSYAHASLSTRAHFVSFISRQHPPSFPSYDITQQWWQVIDSFPDCDVVIQATGTNVLTGGVLTPEVMKAHYDSRVGVTRLLAKCLRQLDTKPKTFILTSSAYYYPNSRTEVFGDDYAGPHANNFLGEIFSDMEQAAREELSDLCERLVIVRLGHVLAPEGLLEDVHKKHKWAKLLVGRLGSGKQWFPWVHVADMADIYTFITENENIRGVVNVVAPEQVQQRELGRQFRRQLKNPRPFVLPAPKFLVNYWFTDRSFYLLEGRRVVSSPKLAENGYKWRFPTLGEAVADLYRPLRGEDISVDLSWFDKIATNDLLIWNRNNPMLTWGTRRGKLKKVL